MKWRKFFIGALPKTVRFVQFHFCFFLVFLRDDYLPIDGKFWGNETHPSPTLHQSTRMAERRRARLQMWGYRLLFCVTLITPWPNLFPQRSPGKAFRGVLLEKVQHSRCGPAATEGQAARCRAESRAFVRRWRRAVTALRPFSPSICCFFQPVSL